MSSQRKVRGAAFFGNKESRDESYLLLQFRVLRLGLLQDGDVGVGVFPQREEIVVRSAGFGGVTV
jgi:hypothetical protein